MAKKKFSKWHKSSLRMPNDNELVEVVGIPCVIFKARFNSIKDHWEDEDGKYIAKDYVDTWRRYK